jgi:hypothetical protein
MQFVKSSVSFGFVPLIASLSGPPAGIAGNSTFQRPSFATVLSW